MPGDYQAFFEEEDYGDKEERNSLFEYYEEYAEELNVDVTIEDWDDFYSAFKKIGKAQNEEEFGEDYKITVEVDETIEIDDDDLEDIIEMYKDDHYEDYVDVDLIEEGVKVYVDVEIEGENSDSYTLSVWVVKYDGKWKAVYTTSDDRD